jgi:hypothetical protein
MKALKCTLFIALTMLLFPMQNFAQDSEKNLMYRVHEDQVKLSMVSEYEAVVKELIGLMKKHSIPDTHWITLASNDSKYRFISPIKGMADLDKSSFITTLTEKEGEETISGLFDRMDKCYDTELDYILWLDNSLTYMPEGFTQTPEGMNYRRNHMLYVSPGNRKAVNESMKAVKATFEKIGSKEYFRVYRSGFGAEGEFYMVAIAYKDQVDQAQKSKANNALMGEEDKKVFDNLFQNLLKYEVMEGWIRPDLGYSSKNN